MSACWLRKFLIAAMAMAMLALPLAASARPLSESSKSGTAVRLSMEGALDSVSFQNTAGQTGYFSTNGLGASGEIQAKGNGYGLGIRFGFQSNKGNNSANTATSQESISYSRFNLLARIYALDFHIGVGVDYTSAATSTLTNSTTRNESFAGLGLRIETGYDYYFAGPLFLSPRVYYSISKLRPESATGTSTFGAFGVGVGLGFNF